MSLNCVRVEYIPEQDNLNSQKEIQNFTQQKSDGKTDNPAKYCIRLMKNTKYTEIYTSDFWIYQQWYSLFSERLIQTNLHTKYKVESCLGRGSFAKVSLFP